MFIATTILLVLIIAYLAITSVSQERKRRSEQGHTGAEQKGGSDTQPSLSEAEDGSAAVE
jgi:hypothetical protein